MPTSASHEEGEYVTYREFKEYTDQQAQRDVSIAKELATYREQLATKLAGLKNAQYAQIAMLAITLLGVAADLAFRFMHP